jgi:hypothetical protein
MPEQETITGGCLCGGVRFAARLPTLWCAHCHCHWCRRAHGAAFVTWFSVPEEAFTLTQGTEHVVWYASSEQSSRGFCSRCGTTFLFRTRLMPVEMHITLANADGPIDVAPQGHSFFEDHVPWVTLGDACPGWTVTTSFSQSSRACPGVLPLSERELPKASD